MADCSRRTWAHSRDEVVDNAESFLPSSFERKVASSSGIPVYDVAGGGGWARGWYDMGLVNDVADVASAS